MSLFNLLLALIGVSLLILISVSFYHFWNKFCCIFCNTLKAPSLEYGDFIWLKFIPLPKLLLHSKEFQRSHVIFEHLMWRIWKEAVNGFTHFWKYSFCGWSGVIFLDKFLSAVMDSFGNLQLLKYCRYYVLVTWILFGQKMCCKETFEGAS